MLQPPTAVKNIDQATIDAGGHRVMGPLHFAKIAPVAECSKLRHVLWQLPLDDLPERIQAPCPLHRIGSAGRILKAGHACDMAEAIVKDRGVLETNTLFPSGTRKYTA